MPLPDVELPTLAFAEALRALYPDAFNVYPTTIEQLEVPALVLRPDEPWIERSGAGYDLERYVAVAVAPVGDPHSSSIELHRLVHAVADACDQVSGWAWDRSGRIVVDEGTGVPFLAAAVRLIYRDCTHDALGGDSP